MAGTTLMLVSREIEEGEGVRGRGVVMAKGRTALGTVEVEELAPLQEVVVTETWPGLSTDEVMVEGPPSQGHVVRLANGGSIAGEWLVAAGDCALQLTVGTVCTVGVGQWEYLPAGA